MRVERNKASQPTERGKGVPSATAGECDVPFDRLELIPADGLALRRDGTAEDGYALVEMAASPARAMPQQPYLPHQALTMRLRDNLNQSDIADHLSCSQMQVSQLSRRAATRLRELTDPDLASQDGATVAASPCRP